MRTRQHRLTISAGEGPVEAREFVALLGELLRERCVGLGLEVTEVVAVGPERAPSSLRLTIAGEVGHALDSELGVHCLLARSSRRGRRSRKRWFASVALGEAPAAEARLSVSRSDLEVSASRAGGPGGQRVNKVSSAVRVAHRPSGLAVRVSSSRSQHQNLRRAIEQIEGRLRTQQRDLTQSGRAAERLSHHRLRRGDPVRTYRLDHRGRLQSISPRQEEGLLGKRLLVGLTYLDATGEVTRQVQLHGRITRISAEVLELELPDGAGTFTLPPDLEALEPAPPGQYRLRSTGEVVVDPDFLCSWTIHAPPDA